MSRVRHPTERDLVALNEYCPTCYVTVGEWCLTTGGALSRPLHAARFEQARYRYRGLPESQNDPEEMKP